MDDKSQLYDATKSFYQPKIKLYSDTHSFSSFDDYTDLSKINDQEELNLKLLYRNYQSFGTGHGAAVSWNEPNEQLRTGRVESQIMPLFEVMGNDFEPDELIERDGERLIKDCEILYMKRLAGEEFHSNNESSVTKEQLISELNQFSKTYGEWIGRQQANVDESLANLNIQDVDKQRLKERADKNLNICSYLKKRMDQGIELIMSDPIVYQAFTDANKAMFKQRVMSEFIKQRKKKYGDKIFPEDGVDESLPDFKEDYAFKPEKNEFLAKWRPFQLAFLLSQVEGIVDPNSDDRETVDLIWFTTGGGKTEAYLGLIAFLIFHRRLRAKKNGSPNDGAGVTSIMRYTLRLLNKQQFNRAAPLICSCELIRREYSESYGNKEVSLGIWVGSSLTPNKWEDFFESFDKSRLNPNAKVEYTIPLYECPCCGTRLMPDDVDGDWGIKGKPHRGGGLKKPAYLHCTNSKCEFYVTGSDSLEELKKKSLPIYFVDEAIYEERPTLLFATADKFAFINWRNDSYKLFNLIYENGDPLYKYPPPELIVQDELHLIDSALGTIYGVYEMALDKFCSQDGVKPKVIAATATARNAEKQCKLLYGREKFLQFPPSGIDIDDSFFARKIKKTDGEEGRYYVGLQPSGVTNTVAQIRLIGTLLQRIPMMEFDNQVIDKYYTTLVYFNSLRELGKFRTLIEDDIVAYKNFLSKQKQFLSLNTGYQEDRTTELSSALDSDQISSALEMLEKAELPNAKNDDAIKFFRLGIRRLGDIESLDNSDEWFKHNYRNGKHWFKGEFYEKFNSKEVFESFGIEFKEGDSLDVIEKNEREFRSKAEELLGGTSRNVAHVASATSMISVGVDIPRLNVMQVTGQPKSHSEYIQASSRVGRDKPGVVFTTYNPAKNRDRSHYEKFWDYHQAFYKDVEPTTITPYSLPALEKALPAVIFALMQSFHFGGDVENANWTEEADKKFEEIRDYLIQRVEKTINSISDFGQSDIDVTKKYINQVCDQVKNYWSSLSERYQNIRFSEFKDYPRFGDYDVNKISRSVYVQSNKSVDFPGKPSCMTSIRNVESGSEIKIEKLR